MQNIINAAIQSCTEGKVSFTKFISANDAGKTGGHQAGFYIPFSFCKHIFEEEINRGTNYVKFVEVNWQNDFITKSRFKYYGSKNECHFTRFQKGFPFLTDDNVGNLLVVTKKDSDYYEAFVIASDEEIEEFFTAFGISSTETNKILPKTTELTAEERLKRLFQQFIEKLTMEFPPTTELAAGARNISMEIHGLKSDAVLEHPDKELLNWITTEFDLFKAIENNRYGELIKNPFQSVDELINIANTILNRRKSRAGKSLEHHLSQIFNTWNLSYSSQAVTEQNKKPDFIFPNIESYFTEKAGSNKLIFLAAKTTCKDRWRQIVGEADKIPEKHLFTLQQGISKNQLDEMKSFRVTLVVPKPYIDKFPKNYRSDIWTLEKFVRFVKSRQ
ncbi:MAG TPA: type II restriction endonuclease [Mariniphaga sp.]|nr:type II restriction endonuclease [Mariniphaga sp.]